MCRFCVAARAPPAAVKEGKRWGPYRGRPALALVTVMVGRRPVPHFVRWPSIRTPSSLQCAHHWQRVMEAERWGPDWGRLALAAADRIELALGASMDTLYQLMQPHAEAFQAACGIDQART